MCGIVAYIGQKEAYPILIKGLQRLEYRGYDSAGVALLHDNDIHLFKINLYTLCFQGYYKPDINRVLYFKFFSFNP